MGPPGHCTARLCKIFIDKSFQKMSSQIKIMSHARNQAPMSDSQQMERITELRPQESNAF